MIAIIARGRRVGWLPLLLLLSAPGVSAQDDELDASDDSESAPTFLWATYGFGATNGMAGILAGSLQRADHVFSLRAADTYQEGIVDVGILYGRVLRTGRPHLSASIGIAPVFGWRVSTTVGIPLEVQAFLRGRAVGFGVYGFGNLNLEEPFVGWALSIQGGRLPRE